MILLRGAWKRGRSCRVRDSGGQFSYTIIGKYSSLIDTNLMHEVYNFSRSSLAHGTPPSVSNHYYDVPLSLSESTELSSSHPAASAVAPFHRLCWLTKILGTMLPLIYTLQLNPWEAWKSIRRLECELDEWEDSMPNHLEAISGEQTLRTQTSTMPALWFYYLSLKLTLQRLAYKVRLVENAYCMLSYLSADSHESSMRNPSRSQSISIRQPQKRRVRRC